jgi:hypothetical protein
MTKPRKTFLVVVGLILAVFFVFIAWASIYSSSTISTNQPPAPSSTPAPIIIGTSTTTPTSSVESTPPIVINNTVPPSAAASDIGHAVGIAAGGGLSKISTSTLNDKLDQIVALGATWVRVDIEWGDVQYSSPNDSNWTDYDTLVNAIAAHHLKTLVIILFTPQWARNPSCGGGAKCPPADPNQFATFASEVAARYKGKVEAYEVWNEPNNYNFWATKTDCDAYTALLKVTYPAIKKADSNAIVVTGGLAPENTDNNNISQTDFLSCVYNDGGKNYFDAVGDHAYTFPTLPSANNTNVWAQMSETNPSLRSIMTANGDAKKKIWITEFGTPTDGPDPHWFNTEAQQAAMVTDSMNLYKTYSWVGPIFWYTLQDGGTSTSTSENFFGLVRADGSLKPAYTTLQSMISAGL